MAVDVQNQTQSQNSLGGTQSAQGSKGVGDSSGTNVLSGDNALLKAMLMQIEELNTLTNAATSESGLSVALRKYVQAKATDKVTELTKLLQLCIGGEGSTGPFTFLELASQNGFSALMKAFPGLGLSGVPTSCRDDFVTQLQNLITGTTVSQFRANVGQLNSLINQASTNVSQKKTNADQFQTGATNLTQSITQFLAQLATESGLMSDVVAQ